MLMSGRTQFCESRSMSAATAKSCSGDHQYW
jgi:hypothetical protein